MPCIALVLFQWRHLPHRDRRDDQAGLHRPTKSLGQASTSGPGRGDTPLQTFEAVWGRGELAELTHVSSTDVWINLKNSKDRRRR